MVSKSPGTWSLRLPGLLLSLSLAAIAWWLGTLVPIIGGPVFGILLGMVVRASGRVSQSMSPGITFSSKQLLQISIVLLGSGLSLRQVYTTGAGSLAVMLTTMATCLGTAWLMGRLLGVSSSLTTLVGVGTAICGASAVAAVAPVIEAEDQDVAYSISTVFTFNVMAVLLFPALGHLMGLGMHSFGLWAGTAINDTSSVVAAAYSYGQEAGTYATVVKLARATMIIPIALIIAAVRSAAARRDGAGKQVNLRKIFPWFILGFLGASVINSIGVLPAPAIGYATVTGKFLIVVALTAIGLSAQFKQIAKTGFRPILLGLTCWAVVAVTSLLVQRLTGQLG